MDARLKASVLVNGYQPDGRSAAVCVCAESRGLALREQYSVNLAREIVHVVVAEERTFYVAHFLPALKLSAVDICRARTLCEISVVLVLENIPVLVEMPVATNGFPHLPGLRLSEKLIFFNDRDVLKQQSGQGSTLVFFSQLRRVSLVPVYLILVNDIVI